MTTTDMETGKVFKMEPTEILQPSFDGKVQVISRSTEQTPKKISGYPWFAKPNRDAPYNPADLSQLIPGQIYDITYVRENLKKDKTGEANFDYYWGIWSVDDAGQGPQIDTPLPQSRQDAPMGSTAASNGNRASSVPPIDGPRFGQNLNIAADLRIAFPEKSNQEIADEVIDLAVVFYSMTPEELWAKVLAYRASLEEQEESEDEDSDGDTVGQSEDDGSISARQYIDSLSDDSGDGESVVLLGNEWRLNTERTSWVADVLQDNGKRESTALGIHVADVVTAVTKGDYATILSQIAKRYSKPTPQLTPTEAKEFLQSKGMGS